MFNDSKYTIWYFNLIDKIRLEKRKYQRFQFEDHHIIPKSLGGGNETTNLILLTYKEHFLFHWLLTKMCVLPKDIQSMYYALSCMRRPEHAGKIIASWQYAKMREAASRATTGVPKSDSHRAALGDAIRGRKFVFLKSDPNIIKQLLPEEAVEFVAGGMWSYGMGLKYKTPTRESALRGYETQKKNMMEKYGVENISQVPEFNEKKKKSLTGRIRSETHCKNISLATTGISKGPCSEDRRAKLAAAKTGFVRIVHPDYPSYKQVSKSVYIDQYKSLGWLPQNIEKYRDLVQWP